GTVAIGKQRSILEAHQQTPRTKDDQPRETRTHALKKRQFMNPLLENRLLMTRRHFFGRTATGIGAAALGSLLNPNVFAALAGEDSSKPPLGKPHFPPKAKRVIYLFMAGGPSHMDLLDYKPTLEKLHESELPDSVRMGQR